MLSKTKQKCGYFASFLVKNTRLPQQLPQNNCIAEIFCHGCSRYLQSDSHCGRSWIST